MWRDAGLALYEKRAYLERAESNRSADELTAMTPYVDSLQQKCASDIEINLAAFEEIRLTRVAMLVLEEDVPFPIYVPAFPQRTTDQALDYGHRMAGL